MKKRLSRALKLSLHRPWLKQTPKRFIFCLKRKSLLYRTLELAVSVRRAENTSFVLMINHNNPRDQYCAAGTQSHFPTKHTHPHTHTHSHTHIHTPTHIHPRAPLPHTRALFWTYLKEREGVICERSWDVLWEATPRPGETLPLFPTSTQIQTLLPRLGCNMS